MNAEMTVFAWKVNICDLTDKAFRTFAVSDEVFDGNDMHPMLLCKFLEMRCAHHVAIVIHDFATNAAGIEPRKTQEIGRCLRMPRTAKDAALDRTQRKNMSRTAETRGFCHRIDHLLDCLAALVS